MYSSMVSSEIINGHVLIDIFALKKELYLNQYTDNDINEICKCIFIRIASELSALGLEITFSSISAKLLNEAIKKNEEVTKLQEKDIDFFRYILGFYPDKYNGIADYVSMRYDYLFNTFIEVITRKYGYIKHIGLEDFKIIGSVLVIQYTLCGEVIR